MMTFVYYVFSKDGVSWYSFVGDIFFSNSREERQNASTENSTATESPLKEKDVTLKRALDDALGEAIRNHSELQSVYESLFDGLQIQMRKEKNRLLVEISEMTKKAVSLIQKRKVTLISQLGALDHWFSESHVMLQKVLEALRAPVDMQAFDLSCLNQRTGLRCYLDEEKLEQCLGINQGNTTSIPKESAAPTSRRLSKSPLDSRHSPSFPKTPSSSTASDWEQEYQRLPNTRPIFSPNVIIEEIVEDSTLVRLYWVVVTHVVNPGHFYVRYVSAENTADQLRRVINAFCSGNKGQFSPEHTISKGDLLFAFCPLGGWYRVEVLEVYQSGAGEIVRQCKAADVFRLKVFFLDHGFQKTLSVPSGAQQNLSESLRKPDRAAHSEISRWPPQAIRCCLNGIVPAQVRGWSTESIKEFRLVTGSSAVQMQVFRDDKKTMLVDLKKSPMDHTNSRMPLSLRDHMVYMEFARFYCPVPASANSCKPLQYYPPVSPKPNTEFYAIVSHINTPADFFIQLTENMEFPLLTAKLQALYKARSEELSLQLSCPMLEQACVAPYDEDIWYRARVTGFHGTQMAEVQFVDLGSIRLVPVNNLRVIKDEFLSLPAMAVWCRLADAESNGDYWSDASINRFRDLAEKKLVTVVTKKFTSCYGPLPVCLFEGDDKRESKSISHILITEELAQSPKNLPPTTPEVSSWDPPLETVEAEYTPPGPADAIQLSPSITIPASQKDIKVRVCHVTSPANIFVQLLQYDRQLKRLQERLQQEFGGSSPMSVDWEVGMSCAALVQGIWERGKISGILSSNMTEVLCCDYGTRVSVPVDNLRPLPPRMIGSLVLECCLSGIRPAGGPKWTATSCDLISFYLTGAMALMTIKEPPPAHPVGVSLLCSNRAGQNISMADFLISEGLALPDRKYRCGFKREVGFQELLEPKSVEALPTLEDPHEGSRNLPHKEEKEEDEDNKNNIHPGDHTAEVAPATDDYPPPQQPEHRGNTCLTITAVGDDGVIYSMTPQAETELKLLKKRLQQHIKATPVFNHHNWRNVKGCIIKGRDMLWHRGRVVELTGGQVKLSKGKEPQPPDLLFYYEADILSVISEPEPVNSRHSRLTTEEWKKFQAQS
ncbi:hypothetical protein ACEWY4_001168 [Coilia grayii]|uniref:Tudor domain-containing protein n=1 Tax=Coilia grayii TaxID=363190 RepID=A0ABD1KYT2_9TELE